MKGFTKLELLIVVLVMVILGSITYQQFALAEAKSRDGERKSNLHELSKIIRLYYSDYKKLPNENLINDLWGKKWLDGGHVYMERVPSEKYIEKVGKNFCYKINDGGNSFKLFAELENRRDVDCKNIEEKCNGQIYCFVDNLDAEIKK